MWPWYARKACVSGNLGRTDCGCSKIEDMKMRASLWFLAALLLLAPTVVFAGDATVPGDSCADADKPAGMQQAINNALYLCTTTGATRNWYPQALYVGASAATCNTAHAGLTRYNSGALEICNGTSWAAVGGASILGSTTTGASPYISGDATSGFYSPGASTVGVVTAGTEVLRFTATGSIGLAKATPTTSVDFSAKTDGLLLQTAAAAAAQVCASNYKGAIRFNSTLNNVEFCDGTNWKYFAASTVASCTGTSAFSFTNAANAPLSTLTTSNIITPAGCAASLSVSVSGGGSPQISVDGGAWTTNTSISPGQTLQIRLTSSASASTVLSAVVVIGTTTGTTWTVTTKASNTRIFSTSGTYTGNLGGLSGADTICNSAAAALSYGGYWMALLSDSVSSAKDRLSISYPVVKASNTATTIAGANLWSGGLSNAVGAGSGTWTGMDSSGTNYNAYTGNGGTAAGYCNDWANGSSSYYGVRGIDNQTDSGWLIYYSQLCNNINLIYCIEQPSPGCTPGAFSFTNATSQALSTLVTSNTITPSGCATASTARVSGDGSPQISINGGAWTTSGAMSPGNTIQVRLTTTGAYSQANRARVEIGSAMTTWTATTLANTGTQIFPTSGVFTGNLGGLLGADALCNSAATAAGYSATYWMAILSDHLTDAKDRLAITYPVTRASDGVVVSPTTLWGGSISVPLGSSQVWTGSDAAGARYNLWGGTNSVYWCNDWTTGSSSYVAENGYAVYASSNWLNYSGNNCAAAFTLYCVSQPSQGCSPTGATTFTNLTNQALSTQITSNTITPTGCGAPATVLVSGEGSPQISINGGAWGAGGTLAAGGTLQVRLTTANGYGNTRQARIYIGGVASTWSVTTGAASGTQIFATTGSYNGNLGGLLGADAICQGAATAAGYSAASWKAILSDHWTSANQRLAITYPVYRASDGSTVAAANLWSGSLSVGVGGATYAWTGTSSVGNANSYYSGTTAAYWCNDWTDGSGSTLADAGYANATNSSWMTYTPTGCNGSAVLYCIEQPSPGCTPTGAYTFTNLTNQAINTLVTSATITPTGCGAASKVMVSGDGGPQISINGGGWTTSGTLSAGNTLQVRLTTANAYSNTLTAVIYIGALKSTWTASTTSTAGNKVFMTNGSYVGGTIGGLSGADTICNSEAGILGYAGTYKAILSDQTTGAAARLTFTYPITRASDGYVVATSNIWSGTLINAIGGAVGVWTGTYVTGGTISGHNCTSWTSTSGDGVPGYGSQTNGGATNYWGSWLDNMSYGTGQSCASSYRLYCISQ